MRRAVWEGIRTAEIKRAKAVCEHCWRRPDPPRFDVVPNGRARLVLCRSCRRIHDSPVRVAKSLATKRNRALQLRLVPLPRKTHR